MSEGPEGTDWDKGNKAPDWLKIVVVTLSLGMVGQAIYDKLRGIL